MIANREGFIAVHLGAGRHSTSLYDEYKKLGRLACKRGLLTLKASGSVLDAVTSATVILEDSPLTNAGYGSNLNYSGDVECDASVMDGETLHYGAVGAINSIKNPIEVAKLLCKHQSHDIGHGRIPPSFLVGNGASMWAKNMGIQTVSPETLISEKSSKIYKVYKRKVENSSKQFDQPLYKKRLDTVGAVCVDNLGNISAACSSGGIILKYPGRIGQAAVYGCGVWASKNKISVATSTTGNGEYLIRTTLARSVADSIAKADCPTISMHDAMRNNFIESRFLNGINEKLAGVLAIRYSVDDTCGDVLWGNSSDSMIISCMNSTEKSAKSYVCTLPKEQVGKNAVVEGSFFKLPKIYNL